MLDEVYKKYRIAGIIVQARKSPGGGFYDVILPDGEQSRFLATAFEDVANEVKDADSTTSIGNS
jgi:hypothetical protein